MADSRALKKLVEPSPVVELSEKRKRGRPPGSGRKPGTPNHSTRKLRLKIHKLGKPVETVCKVAAGDLEIDGLSQGDALKLLFKSVVPELRGEVVTGEDGGPVELRTQVLEASARVVEALRDAADKPEPALALGDEPLRALQAANFLMAQRDAARRRAKAPVTAPGESPVSGKAIRHLVDTPDAASARPGATEKDEESVDELPDALEPGEDAHVGGFVIRCLAATRPNTSPTLALLVGCNGSVLGHRANDLHAAVDWLHDKFPETRGERVTVRPAPTRTSYSRPDERGDAATRRHRFG